MNRKVWIALTTEALLYSEKVSDMCDVVSSLAFEKYCRNKINNLNPINYMHKLFRFAIILISNRYFSSSMFFVKSLTSASSIDRKYDEFMQKELSCFQESMINSFKY